jgi:ABC-2 type transport system permease protein
MYFIALIKNIFFKKWAYKFNFFLEGIEVIISLLVQLLVWVSLFNSVGNKAVTGYNISDLITYTIVSRIAGMVTNIKLSLHFADAIQSGDIALSLIRPYSPRLIFIINSIGNTFCNAVTAGIPTILVFVFFLSDVQLPASRIYLIFFLISLLLGLAICISIELLSGVLAFWKVPGDFMEWYFSIFFVLLSGSVIPLWFFPQWLLIIAKVLPFQAVFFIPAQLYMGKFSIIESAYALLIQLGWIALLLTFHEMLWRRGIRNLTILGG